MRRAKAAAATRGCRDSRLAVRRAFGAPARLLLGRGGLAGWREHLRRTPVARLGDVAADRGLGVAEEFRTARLGLEPLQEHFGGLADVGVLVRPGLGKLLL